MGDQYAKYKNRTYLLKFLGKTRFGERAKLAFLDGSSEFWVDAKKIRVTSAPHRTKPRRCRECDGPLIDLPNFPCADGWCGQCVMEGP